MRNFMSSQLGELLDVNVTKLNELYRAKSAQVLPELCMFLSIASPLSQQQYECDFPEVGPDQLKRAISSFQSKDGQAGILKSLFQLLLQIAKRFESAKSPYEQHSLFRKLRFLVADLITIPVICDYNKCLPTESSFLVLILTRWSQISAPMFLHCSPLLYAIMEQLFNTPSSSGIVVENAKDIFLALISFEAHCRTFDVSKRGWHMVLNILYKLT